MMEPSMIVSEPREPGLLLLRPVPKFTKNQDAFAKKLFQAIREASATGAGRDTAMEDFYHEIISYHRLRSDEVYLVRMAMIDDKGRPYGNLSVAETLYQITEATLRHMRYNIITRLDERYDHFYNPKALDTTSYLYVPDTQYVKNLVVERRHT